MVSWIIFLARISVDWILSTLSLKINILDIYNLWKSFFEESVSKTLLDKVWELEILFVGEIGLGLMVLIKTWFSGGMMRNS